ncbi:MAG TPA: metallophosphoesterase [Terriglobales bacterium]|jgi:predicted MPP superfamily phosphohydrolase|nr:metallophosphoesterase [Terriglobales bacterium]
MRAENLTCEDRLVSFRRRQLNPPRHMTGNERRLMNPNRGLIKLFERYMDIVISSYFYPLFGHIWSPYSWLLERRFTLAETKLTPARWPAGLAPLRVLLISDIHAGIFLRPETLWQIVLSLMHIKPDLVVVGGDLVTGHTDEVIPILAGLAPLTHAPLGAWFCFGNHDYFGGDQNELRENLAAVGIKTLKNQSVELRHNGGSFILGGIDDRMFGKPDWQALLAEHGPPHLLMAHNPDHFYEAEANGIPLILSGHTHGGQIRLPNGPAIIRQSRFCLDEGVFAHGSSLLVVSRGLGSVFLPLRWGADPEAVLIEVIPPR